MVSGGGTSGEIDLPTFSKDEEVWIETAKSNDSMWQKAKIVEQTGVFVICMTAEGRVSNLDLRQHAVFPINPAASNNASDMTSLYYINEPSILVALETRSLVDMPYTFMGNVLVAVNPLKPIKNPEIMPNERINSSMAHPYSVAENAFMQMTFSFDNKLFANKSANDALNQSVVTSGESGAGKTECCKMVLRYLVESLSSSRSMDDKQGLSAIDVRLLESNHITEAFGNASTLRNHNSSRFGKFMKLHFNKKTTGRGKGHRKQDWEIIGASVETYLLERSRVSLHGDGERTYHVFYQLFSGIKNNSLAKYMSKAENDLLVSSFKQAESSPVGFRYLSALSKAEASGAEEKHTFLSSVRKTDLEEFQNVLNAMEKLDFMSNGSSEISEIFKAIAGIMHLGNIIFQERIISNIETAIVDTSLLGAYDPLKFAALLLGVNQEFLMNLLTKEELVVRNQKIIKVFDATKACATRDALAKALYSMVFDYVITLIDNSLTLKDLGSTSDSGSMPFIGILDIFGFENYDDAQKERLKKLGGGNSDKMNIINGFSVFLINFTNEALSSVFNRSVFENEAALYKRERLVLDQSDMIKAPSNSACMTLFLGDSLNDAADFEIKRGLLLTIDDESQSLDPNDKKMLANLHRNFGKHSNWIRPHPKLKQEMFIIRHYAGDVKYTVGSFIDMNKDKLPKQMSDVFQVSSSPILNALFNNKVKSKRAVATQSSTTIIKKFRTQMNELVETLETTKCSFIRCVKPNEDMQRGSNSLWFNRRYISHQLRNLAIPQTAEVLQSGFPTRLTYSMLMDTYMKILPQEALNTWTNFANKKGSPGSESNYKESLFIKALLYAFGIDRKNFKLGLTMVFFKSGELANLDQVLKSSANFESSTDKLKVIKKFKYYYVRLRWREAYAKIFAFNRFKHILADIREKERIRQERIRLEKERIAKELAEKERLEKAQKDKMAQLETERLADEQRIKEQLEHERIRREKEKINRREGKTEDELSVVDDDSEQERIAALYDNVEAEARKQAKEELGSRNSATPSELDEMTRRAMEQLEATVAQAESQSRMEQKLQNFYLEILNNTSDIWEKGREALHSALETVNNWLTAISETDTYAALKARHEKNMLLIQRTIRVTNRLLLKQARKAEWFQEAEQRLNSITDAIVKEFENEVLRENGQEVPAEPAVTENEPPAGEQSPLHKRMSARRAKEGTAFFHKAKAVNGENFMKFSKVTPIDAREYDTAEFSTLEHIAKVRQLIEDGEIPPSALGDLVNTLEKSANLSIPAEHANQFSPANSISSHGNLSSHFDSPFPTVNPSDDLLHDWVKNPLAFHKGDFFVSGAVKVLRNSKVSVLCAWEHADQKKKNRLFTHWDVDMSVSSFALIYDAILTAAHPKIKKLKEKCPVFPGWNEEIYDREVNAAKKGSKVFGLGLFGGSAPPKSRGERLKAIRNAIDEDVVLTNPKLLGQWFHKLFALFGPVLDDKTADGALLQVPMICELLDVDTYGGVENL